MAVQAPIVEDPRKWDFKFKDREEMIFKQNALNQWRYDFSQQLTKMVEALNGEFQFVDETRIEITKKAGQVAADRQHVDAQKKAIDTVKSHVDAQKKAVDTTAGQVDANARTVASDKATVAKDKQAAAQSASAASGSAGAAQDAQAAAEGLYGDLDAVRAARAGAEQSAQTAGQQAQTAGQERGKAETARKGAEKARTEAEAAAKVANADIDGAIVEHTKADNPHSQYARLDAAETLHGTKRFSATLELLRSAIALAWMDGDTQLAFGEANSSYGLRFRTRLGGTGEGIGTTFTLENSQDGGISWNGSATTDGDYIMNTSSGTSHLWARENGQEKGVLYWPAFGNSTLMGLRAKDKSGKTVCDMKFKSDGSISTDSGVWTGNGSGLTNVDAEKLSGMEVSWEDNPNTVVTRDGSKDIKARLFRSTFTSQNSDIAVFYTSRSDDGTDYMRPSSPEQVKAALGVTNAGNLDSGLIPNSRIRRTASRTDDTTDKFLVAAGMFNHCNSGDHDSRYYTKNQVDSAIESSGVTKDIAQIGTYGVFIRIGSSTINRGEIVSGSDIRWSPMDKNNSGPSPAGSWQLHSRTISPDTTNKGLFMRVR